MDGPESLVGAIQSAIPATGSSGKESKVKIVLQRQGKESLTLEGTPAELKPVGKIGVNLTQVMSLAFHRKTTCKIIAVQPGSLAEQMGFQVNDELYSIDDYTLFDEESLESSLAKLSKAWPAGSHTVNMKVARPPEGVNLVLKVAPPPTVAAFGLQLEPISAAMILKAPFKWIGHFIIAPVKIGEGLVKGMLSFKTLKQGSAGPIGMMQMIYEVSDEGLPAFFFFLAILNAAVGAFNVIPFPALDGSRCLILMLSWVRGKEFDSNREAQFHFLGLLVLLSLVLLMSFQDVSRWLAGTPLMK